MWNRAHGAAGTESARTPDSDAPPDVAQYLISRGLAADDPRGRQLLRGLLDLAARHPERRVTLQRASRALLLSRRSLARQCRRAGLPCPSRILALGRLLHAVEVLRKTGWSVSRVAAATGWPDPFTLSNCMHHLTGLRPSTARRRGTVYLAEAWLRNELRSGGAELRAPSPPACPSCGQEVDPEARG